jgi:hypothetical protein
VAAFTGLVLDRHLRPGQALELPVQAGLVVLHSEQIRRTLGLDEPAGVLALGVQGVGRDHGPGQVQGIEQRREAGVLVGLAVNVDLAEDHAGVLLQHGE